MSLGVTVEGRENSLEAGLVEVGTARGGRPVMERIGVLAVDDQPIFLDVAREVVAATPGFRWLGGATCGVEGLDAVGKLGPALVLLDVRMPGMDGIETARQIAERHPDVLVVLVSVDESPALTPAVEASGAATLVRKQEFGPAMLRRLWRTHRRRATH